MPQQLVLDRQLDSAKNLAWWMYVAHAACLLFSLGALSVLPLILNYVQRPATTGSFVHSHHGWMIRSFWCYLALIVLGGLLFATIIGIPLAWLVWVGAWMWKAYRLVKGISALNRNEAMPA